VKVMALEYLAGVVQGMDNGTLARAIRPEEQRDRLQFKGHLVADGLEVLNCDRSDHRPEPPVSISHGASARSTATEANSRPGVPAIKNRNRTPRRWWAR